MGPNGSGKSTLARVLTGREGYRGHGGRGALRGPGPARSLAPGGARPRGVFLAFQYPVEIPGISNSYFLQARGAQRHAKHRGESELDAIDFLKLVREKADAARDGPRDAQPLRERRLQRRREEAQRDPADARARAHARILDETDSGLDIDALKVVAKGVNALPHPERSFLVITHYQRLLDYIVPDFVHVLADGRIVRSGGKELALELEEKGYAWIDEEAAAS